MTTLSRRSFVQIAAAVPAAPLVTRLPETLAAETVVDDPDSGELNVIFHGVWLFMYNENDSDWITVYGPPVDDVPHVYWAGNWQQEEENDLTKQKTCELQGTFTNAGDAPSENETSYPVIECATLPDPSKAVCTIRLPIPHKIVGLRALHKIDHEEFFSGGYHPTTLNRLPLVYAFVYKYNAKATRPRLANTSWIAPNRPGIANLHIRAERKTLPQEDHSGFSAIRDLLGYNDTDLSMNFKYTYCEIGPDLFPKVRGLSPEEEYFLPELFPNVPVHLPGSSQKCARTAEDKSINRLQPANCSGIFGRYYLKNEKSSQ